MSFIQENPILYLAIACFIAVIADVLFGAWLAKRQRQQIKLAVQREHEASKRQLAMRRESEAKAARFAHGLPTPDSGDGWFALIGSGHLELRDTGFYIQFKPTDRDHPYHLQSPEGGLIARGASLHAVKIQGAISAAERAEFASWSKGRAS
jgi:hypothetical protein